MMYLSAMLVILLCTLPLSIVLACILLPVVKKHTNGVVFHHHAALDPPISMVLRLCAFEQQLNII
jgi:uncharacterized protein YceK